MDLVRAYGLTQTPLDDAWCLVHYSHAQQDAALSPLKSQSLIRQSPKRQSLMHRRQHSDKSAALYHHEIVNNLCHALPFVPRRWSPKEHLPTAAFIANLNRRWHVAYALEFVIYHPPIVMTPADYLRSKAIRLRDLRTQHQHFVSQLPVQESHWQQRPDGTYSGSFLVSKWHVMTFARQFDERFAKLGYKRFGAWPPYSFASPPADG